MISENSFSKKFRLLNKSDFQNLRFESRFLVSDVLLFYFKDTELGNARIGLAISKKIGKASKRNRVRRQIREVFRLSGFRSLKKDILITLNYKLINKNKLSFEDVDSRIKSSLIDGLDKVSKFYTGVKDE